jgi:undecaprenyl diphosphate synthase
VAVDFASQSTFHVAVLPDGNGRWARERGLLRSEGHRAGMEAVRRTVRAAPALEIGALTIQALSCDNWLRPAAEVLSILAYVGAYLDAESRAFASEGIRVTVIGRRDRLPPAVLRSIDAAERATAGGSKLHVRLAVDFSSRAALREAFQRQAPKDGAEVQRDPRELLAPPVDLLVRSGGEQRLSDFLLWECAYAELVFLPILWPEFGAAELEATVAEFRRRDRLFGGLSAIPLRMALPPNGHRAAAPPSRSNAGA